MHQAGRIRWPVYVLLTFLGLVGVGAVGLYWVAEQLGPQPERYAPGVVTGGGALDEAPTDPVARAYLDNFATQETWSSCGPSSVVNLLASAGRPVPGEGTLFEGNPFDELRMRVMGTTMDRVGELLRAQGIGQVTILRNLPFEAFVLHLQRSKDLSNRYIVNFDRKPIFGVPVPHFSPIGGYDPETGMVTLLDATPSYGPSLVPARLLYEGVQTRETETGHWRGLIRVELDDPPKTPPDSPDAPPS